MPIDRSFIHSFVHSFVRREGYVRGIHPGKEGFLVS
jgi:hypothetical protein